MVLKQPQRGGRGVRDLEVNPIFSREPVTVPRFALPAGELDPATAYQVLHDELMLDGNARLNLATFVTTWAEPQARRLMAECAEKNMIDKDEYPQTAEVELRCVHMLARLWHAEDPRQAMGCSTTGSSEAAMLGGLALKRCWQHRRREQGRPADRPNLVMGMNVQICWEKFANYFEVETGEHYWISGPRKDGKDRLYPSNEIVPVDEDVQDEYWRTIRGTTPPSKRAEA